MTGATTMTPTTAEAWLLALRPKTLPTGFAPIFFGLAVSVVLEGVQDLPALGRFLLCLVLVMLLQGASNLVNDVKDFDKGVDHGLRLGPARAVQKGWLAATAVVTAYRWLFAAAFGLGVWLCLTGGLALFFLGLSCLAAAYLYSGGPWPLSHLGLGEPLALVFFGPVAVAGTSRLLCGYFASEAVLLGFVPGFLAAAMMAVNNARDIETDRKAGKRTLAVRLGVEGARKVPAVLLFMSLGFLVLTMAFGIGVKSLIWTVPILFLAPRFILPLMQKRLWNQVLGRFALLNLALSIAAVIATILSAAKDPL